MRFEKEYTIAVARALAIAMLLGLAMACTDSSTGPQQAKVEENDPTPLPGTPPPDDEFDEEPEKPEENQFVDPSVVDEPQTGQVFIVDRTGKKWDVTHAKKFYGMQPDKFQFGLGPYAIEPIINPQMLSPGDDEYPETGTFRVLGTVIENQAFAYGISQLARNEVAVAKHEGVYFAPAY